MIRSFPFLTLALAAAVAPVLAGDLESAFRTPSDAARPGVYWWFRDVAVIAYPSPRGEAAMIDETEIKTLKDVLPYSIRRTQQRYVMPRAAYAEPDATQVLDPARAVDLTSRLQPDGTIQWDIPEGDWTVMRFVANRSGENVVTEGVFRIDGLQPQLWDPLTGETRVLGDYLSENGLTRVPLVFEPFQSFFVIFPHGSGQDARATVRTANFPAWQEVARLDGAWDVSFDPSRGGAGKIIFDSLSDWSAHPKRKVKQ